MMDSVFSLTIVTIETHLKCTSFEMWDWLFVKFDDIVSGEVVADFLPRVICHLVYWISWENGGHVADPLAVKVDENLERAIKSLKKKMDKEGIFKELRKRRSYEKPSVRRRAKRARAIRAQRRTATQS